MLAALVEAALPRKLRAIFSAGWGVAPASAGQYVLSCCRDFPPGVVVYDATEHRWSHALDDIGALDSALPRGNHLARHPAAAPVLRFDTSGVRDWVWTVRGELAREQSLRVMESWLGGEGPDAPLPVRPEHLEKSGGMARLLGLLVAALQVEARASRAELVLRDILGGPGRESFLARLRSSASVPTVELLVALIEGDAWRTLVALQSVVAPFPVWMGRRLRPALDATLVQSRVLAKAHAELLAQAEVRVPDYAAWAVENATELAFILGGWAPKGLRGRALAALDERARAPEVGLLRSLDSGAPLPVGLARERLKSAPPWWQSVLMRLAWERWETATREDRTAGLCWLRALDALPDDVLLREGPPVAGDAREITHALESGCVPEELVDQLAVRVLREWPRFREEVGRGLPAWEEVLARWPPHVVHLLVPDAFIAPRDTVPPSPGVEEALGSLTLLPAELESMGQAAAARGVFEGPAASDAAALFLEWCRGVAARGRRHGVVEAVRWLWHDVDATNFAPGREAVEVVAALFRACPLSQEARRVCWRRAATPEALLLLLRLLHEPVEELTLEQLVGLLERKKDVEELLETDPQQRRHLEVCTLDWQSVDMRSGSHPLWRPAYRKTLLSGLFAGLPSEDEAPLADLLAFFARQSGCNRWELASSYLRGRREVDVPEAKLAIWREVVESACTRAGMRPAEFDVILAYSEGDNAGAGAFARGTRPGGQLRLDPAISAPVRLGVDGVLLHPTFSKLLRELGDRALHGGRRASYERTFHRKR
ncbi:hypothetical protein ACLESO_05535 [Pyxidicoccus sp. 3LG]